tara:strand:+ start:2104 stop:3882 length:1779 start_codon:yes stop_codon:yes gene_type:complete
MSFIEIAIKTPRSRGVLIPRNELKDYIEPDVPLYRSVYLYDDKAKREIESKGSVSSYYGSRSVDNILIDIDKGSNTNEQTLRNLRSILFDLQEYDVNINKSCQVFFSGSGYHITLPNSLFNFKASEELPFIVRKTMSSMFKGIDDMIYMRSGIYRVAHTINLKTGLYKIPLTIAEIESSKPEDILELAKTPRLDFEYKPLFGDGELEGNIFTKKENAVRELRSVVENNKVVPCIQTMLNIGPQQGCRNNTIMRIASHFRRHGIPSDFAKVSLLHWNQKSIEENIVIDKVEFTYNKGYQYGCSDPLMAKHCSTRCIFFKRKDYMVDVKTASDLQDEFHERMTTDFSGKIINLGKMFGLSDDIETIIYPGELVTIFGPTGSSKTTLAQNIALGVNFAENRIMKEWQIPTLYLSLELSGWYMHRRNMQVVSGLSKTDINGNYKEVWEEHKDVLSHMAVQTVSPTLEQIKEKVRELQPALVVVDYVDLVATPPHVKGEYEQIKYISHNLSNLAVNMDLIIIQVSQVSREYSRNEVLDLYAGKGSGAIENASRKVLGLNGQADSHLKNLHMYKNTDGELFDCKLEWHPSFRLRKVND